jgi:hypothetical protein
MNTFFVVIQLVSLLTLDHVCQWLFSGENEGVTVIAHNFKGYDSLHILGYLYQNGVKPTIIANGIKNMYIEVLGCRMVLLLTLDHVILGTFKIEKDVSLFLLSIVVIHR